MLSRRGDSLMVGSMSRRGKDILTGRTTEVETRDADEDEGIAQNELLRHLRAP